jgi:ribonuclease Y
MTLILAATSLDPWLATIIGFVVGSALGWFIHRMVTGASVVQARREAERITQTAEAEAEASKQRIELEAEKRAAKRREEVDAELAEAQAAMKRDLARLDKREDNLDRKLEKINATETRLEKRESDLADRSREIEQERAEVAEIKSRVTERLQQVSGMSQDEARQAFLDDVRAESEHEANALTREIIEHAEAEARGKSREITLMAIQRYAAEHVADSTVRSVRIPSDDMKGRIIGREGRNIRAIERATGVDVLVDDTPGVIAVSCFDPIRRRSPPRPSSASSPTAASIPPASRTSSNPSARRSPSASRSPAMTPSWRRTSAACRPRSSRRWASCSFRTSYGQNVLRHSVEVAYLCQIIADQLGLKGDVARRCGFLHDIGKAMDHEMEGGHPAIGMEFCRKHGEKSEAVLNAIGGHHGDIEATTPYTPIVMAADAISGARPAPGASRSRCTSSGSSSWRPSPGSPISSPRPTPSRPVGRSASSSTPRSPRTSTHSPSPAASPRRSRTR